MQAAGFASVPMSKFEPDTKINYAAMDDKLKARALRRARAAPQLKRTSAEARRRAQIIRKRINKPLTLAEKARARRGARACRQGSG